ncbi:hypothetical protein ACFVFS_05230 [Kitasatospora sp. NPDC057692]|uniref:hypothetical protein n=1 Tax=Kitasatospora sp. NPDC057692 TaxID=3346215 RepID=UPI00369773D7
MSDGEWWRKQGPWSEPPAAPGPAGRGGDGDSVYAQEPAPAAPPRPSVPPRPAGPPSAPASAPPSGPKDGAPGAFLPPPTRSPGPSARLTKPGRDGDSPWTAKPAEGAPADPEALPPAYRAVNTGDWDYVSIDFGDGPVVSNRPIPDQRTASEDGKGPGAEGEEPAPGGAAAAEPPAAPKKKGRAGKAKARRGRAAEEGAAPAEGAPAAPDASAPPAKAGGSARHRPSPLLLLSAAVLIGGAVTGQLIAVLIGWALGYVSRHLSDLARKVAVFGIPLMTISGSSLWVWGRAQGRWGTALNPGEQANQVVWESAPGVLRVAAVLSAVFLLLMSLRRRGGGAGGAGG